MIMRERPVLEGSVVFGEVGLAGELRAISKATARVKEAAKLGFTRVVLPQANLERLAEETPKGMSLVAVASLEEALSMLF